MKMEFIEFRSSFKIKISIMKRAYALFYFGILDLR